MPKHETHRKAKEVLESNQWKMTNCSSGFKMMPDDDEFFELLWENGEIVMKGQSSRMKKSYMSRSFSSDASKAREEDEGDAVIPKIERFSNPSSEMNDFSPHGLVHDRRMGPWLSNSASDSLQSDFFSELFPELTTDFNSFPGQSNAVACGGTSNCLVGVNANVVSSQGRKDDEHRNSSEVFVEVSEPMSIRSNQSFYAKQVQSPDTNARPRVSEFGASMDRFQCQPIPRNLIQLPVSTRVLDAEKPKNDPSCMRAEEASNAGGLKNFSHFLRTSCHVKANTQTISTSSIPSAERLKRNEVSTSGSNSYDPSMAVSSKGSKCLVGGENFPSAMVDAKSRLEPQQEPVSVGKFGLNNREEDRCRNNNNSNISIYDARHQSSSITASGTLERLENERAMEPVVASICSGSSAGEASNEPKHAMKRKVGALEEIEDQSEDFEESIGAKKPTNSKRSRTAEVHNLSERRRRDRINEKMRALQELIPNCNKVDKASMLDEAIEYIKTLQLQMQIMSMGSRLYMPPVPMGMQHMGTATVPHFSPLGAGMNVGMGASFGIGMPEANFPNTSHNVPVSSVHGSQHPCNPSPIASNFHAMHVSSLVSPFGVSGQHLPFPHAYPPFFSLSGGFSSKESQVSNALVEATPVANTDSPLASSSKGLAQNIGLQNFIHTDTDCLQNQSPIEETKKCSELGLFQTSYPASPVSGSGINNVSKSPFASSGND